MRTFYDYYKSEAEKLEVFAPIPENIELPEQKVLAILKLILGSCQSSSTLCRLALSAYR